MSYKNSGTGFAKVVYKNGKINTTLTIQTLKKKIMENYMVEISLPEIQDEQFFKLIPAHRAIINNFIENGIIQQYTINAARTKGWILFNCRNKNEVLVALQKMPIFNLIKFKIHEIMIADGELFRLPKMNLN